MTWEKMMFDAKKLLDLLVQSGSGGGASQGGVLGQVGALVGQALNQSATGLGDINRQTGASQKAGSFLQQVTGQNPSDLLTRAKDFAGKNQLATGAAIGGLAAVLLGTGAGRKIIGSATQMGGLALIGGLAYKALQNYQAGKPLLDSQSVQQAIAAPQTAALPAPQEQTRALRLVRAMIAAAASDGVIDATERTTILGNLQAAGLEAEAAQFIEQELANPADIPTLTAGLATPDERAEVYAAARLAIDPDTVEEQAFLASLASALTLEAGLIAHIDAAANAAKTPA